MVCIINFQSVSAIWDEPIKKVCDHEQKKFKILPKLITYTHLPTLNLLIYVYNIHVPTYLS
jgi:hypothetical protein